MSRSRRSASERAPMLALTSHRPPSASITSNFRSRNASSIGLTHDLDDAVDLLVHLFHREPVAAGADVAAVERAVGEGAQREYPLRQPGMRGKNLAETPEALLRLFMLLEKGLEVELVVELVG